MKVAQFGGLRSRFPQSAVTIQAVSGGSLSAGSGDFYFQGHNRAGVNTASYPINVSWSANQKIVISIDSQAIAPGEDLFKIVVSFGAHEILPYQIAEIEVRESDQTTFKTFPLTLELTANSHLASVQTYALTADFPANPKHGALGVLATDSKVYRYSAIATEGSFAGINGGYWQVEPKGVYPIYAVEVGTAEQGDYAANKNMSEAELLIGIPRKTSNVTTPINIWWRNEFYEGSGAIYPSGEKFSLAIAVNGNVTDNNGANYAQLFSGFIETKLKGYVKVETGEFKNTPAAASDWTKWQYTQTSFILPEALEPGYAASWDFRLNYSDSQLANLNNAAISFLLQEEVITSVPSPLGHVLGDCVLASGDKLRVVPTKRLGGTAVLGNPVAGYVQLPALTEEELIAYDADSAGQKVLISNSGNTYIKPANYAENLDVEAIRAIISTLPGLSIISPGQTFNLSSGEQIEITFTYPVNEQGLGVIRSDYPDVIANTGKGEFNPPFLKIWLKFEDIFYERNQDLAISAFDGSQSLFISDLNDFTEIDALPDGSSNPAFCLYNLPAIAIDETIGGSFAGGEYQIFYAYNYPTPNFEFTSISHSQGLGCLAEFNTNFITAVNQLTTGVFKGVVPAVSNLRSLVYADREPGEVWLVKSRQAIYYFDPSSPLADNGTTAIRMNGQTEPLGAFIEALVASGGGGSGGSDLLTERGDLLTVDEDGEKVALPRIYSNGVYRALITGINNSTGLQWADLYPIVAEYISVLVNLSQYVPNSNILNVFLDAIRLAYEGYYNVSGINIPNKSLFISSDQLGVTFIAPGTLGQSLLITGSGPAWGTINIKDLDGSYGTSGDPTFLQSLTWIAHRQRFEARGIINKIPDFVSLEINKPLSIDSRGVITTGIIDYAQEIEGIEKVVTTTSEGDSFWADTVILIQGNSRALDLARNLDLEVRNKVIYSDLFSGNFAYQFTANSSGEQRLFIPTTTNTLLGSSNFTLEFFLKITDLISDYDSMILLYRYKPSFSADTYTAGDFGVKLTKYPSDDYTCEFISLASPQGSLSGTINLPLDEWRHIAFVREGDILTLYCQGIEITSVDLQANGFSSYPTSFTYPDRVPLIIGGLMQHNSTVTGRHFLIDQLRLTKAARYSADFTPTTKPFPTHGVISKSTAQYKLPDIFDTWLFS